MICYYVLSFPFPFVDLFLSLLPKIGISRLVKCMRRILKMGLIESPILLEQTFISFQCSMKHDLSW